MELEMQEAYSEVYEIIMNMPKDYREKIPENVKNFFRTHKRENYNANIDKNNLLDKSKLKQKTLAIIAMLNIKYWCPNEETKKQLIKQYNENEKIYQKELEEKYNIDNILKNKKETAIPVSENMQVIEYKEPKWYQKIFEKIINIFKRRSEK